MLLLKSVEESFLDSAQAILVLLGWWLHDSNLVFIAVLNSPGMCLSSHGHLLIKTPFILN